MIPKGWISTKIADLGDKDRPVVKAGPFGSSLKKEFYKPQGYKIYGQEQVISGDPHFGDYYIDRTKFESLRSCEVKPGDILISLVGTIGKVLLVPEDAEPGIINPRLLRLSFDPLKVYPLFAKYYLESDEVLNQLESLAQGGTMGVLNAQIVRMLPFPLPPLPEQRRIAEIFSAWDHAIDLTSQLIAAKQERKRGLMQQLLMGRRRFAEYSNEWKELSIGELFEKAVAGEWGDEPDNSQDTYPVIRSTNFTKDCQLDLSPQKLVVRH